MAGLGVPRRLGRDVLERDVNRLKSFIGDLNGQTLSVDPLITKDIHPAATNLYDIGTPLLYYQDVYALALHIGDDPSDYQGTIWGSGAVNRPQLEISAAAPYPDGAGNFSLITLQAPGPSGSSGEDSIIYISGGDDNASDIPFIQLGAGSLVATLTEGLGFMLEGPLRLDELSADPTAPGEGEMVMWQSDGNDSGDDGDVMLSIRAGGVTKTTTLVDFSAI